MKRPASSLRDRITVEAYLGTTGQTGPAYAPAVGRWADVTLKRSTSTDATGTKVVGSASAVIVGDDVPQRSRVTYDGTRYTVLESQAVTAGGQVIERRLILGRAA